MTSLKRQCILRTSLKTTSTYIRFLFRTRISRNFDPGADGYVWVAKYQSAIKIGDNFSNPFIRFKPLLLGLLFSAVVATATTTTTTTSDGLF